MRSLTGMAPVELKPCPFCGCRDVELIDGDITGFMYLRAEVYCKHCCACPFSVDAKGFTEDDNKAAIEEVVAMWNTRDE